MGIDDTGMVLVEDDSKEPKLNADFGGAALLSIRVYEYVFGLTPTTYEPNMIKFRKM